ncbi:Gfo/Idh/MocA family protein [Enterococcus sp.]|uniref:Gfo/Idh/MocA family protein n=1 Tax=Enterococcus sp. TaxID=35783 RepID=UPI002FC939AA
MIKYGIVSTASIVPRFVEGVQASQHGEVVAIAARELEKAQKMAKDLAIPKAYGSYAELFADEAIDIVYIATYNKGHYSAAKEALLAGKHVLLEKPFTLTLDEGEELFALAQAQQLFIMEAQKSVFLPITQQVKKWIDEGFVGSVKYMKAFMAFPAGHAIPWFHSLESGGGALYGSGSYPIEYMQYVTNGKIEEVAGTSVMKPGFSDSQCDVSILFEGGVQGNIFITTNFASNSDLVIYGDKGRIHIPHFWRAQEATLKTDDEEKTIHLPHENEFVFEVDHVNECLTHRLLESPIMTEDLTLQTVELVEKMYQQWEQD